MHPFIGFLIFLDDIIDGNIGPFGIFFFLFFVDIFSELILRTVSVLKHVRPFELALPTTVFSRSHAPSRAGACALIRSIV